MIITTDNDINRRITSYDEMSNVVPKCMAEPNEEKVRVGRENRGTGERRLKSLVLCEVNCSDKRSEFKRTRVKLINEST